MVPFNVALATSTCPNAGTAQSAMTIRIRNAKPLMRICDASYSKILKRVSFAFEHAEKCRMVQELCERGDRWASADNAPLQPDMYGGLPSADWATEWSLRPLLKPTPSP